MTARRCSKLIKHRLGIEIVALLEHLHKYLVDGMKTAHYAISLLGTAGLAKRSLNDNARLTQLIGKSLDKYILPADKQWRQYWIVVIPTPSASERIAVLHRLVGIDISAYSVDTHLTNALNEGTHVVVVECRRSPHQYSTVLS